ncbi:MIP transporter [Aspergillus japonicus CBS 114.51]|uniref:MIP transporter n=2 Tax=Aspergillus TaxID=5052 RepID=A0A2V5GY62_ASPV1|nr:MIP transporter [Aspergillus japonicus CBS 114.51]PYI16061.1 MIP transporter [Aspergillus violaceofuscus CBS 115571]RAH78114.1 MIP transporter [Aspergillus japonicus CBS 114.51]
MSDADAGRDSERDSGRPRARSDVDRVREEATGASSPPISPVGRGRRGTMDSDFISPTRRVSGRDGELGSGVRRRSSAASRRSGRSGGIPSLAPRTTLAQRTQGKFTVAGPDDTPQLRLAHEPFVQPGYGDLNPAYEQPVNARPVWGLAKPLPRVVRSGMVPTKEELLEARQNAQLPAENSQKYGLDVDPNDLEQGQIEKTTDPRLMAAQVEDARLQREANFMNKLLSGDTTSIRGSRMSRTSSTRRRRSSAVGWEEQLSTVAEGETPATSIHGGDDEETEGPSAAAPHRGSNDHRPSDVPLQPVPEEPEWHGDDDTAGGSPHLDEELKEGLDDLSALEDPALPEDLHPLVQELVEDEVHNNHTTWSVIRTHHREALAEALGVFVQLFVGFCADLAVTCADAGNPNTTDWAWGFATMMAIYVSGGISGAHFNPAITIMLWFYRGFPKRLMPEYFAAQFLAAFIAALCAYGLYYESIHEYLASNATSGVVNSFVTNQRYSWIGGATAFFNEFLGTMILVIVVLALGDDQNAPPGAGMNSLIVGLMIMNLSVAFAYQTGAAFNPSRDFGPRLALLALGYGSDLFTNAYWFYGPWVGAIGGAMMGGFLYDFFIFTGGESPVNYPWERTERAMRKSKMKWKRRLHLSKEETEKS